MMFTRLTRQPVWMLPVIIATLFVSACATTPTQKAVSIETATAPSADFSAYQTYFVLEVPPGANDIAPPKPFSRVVVEKAVRSELDNRNYREISDRESADMLVAIQFSLQDETRLKKQTTYDIEQTVYQDGYYNTGYGSGYGRGIGRSSRSSRYGNRNVGYSYGYGYQTHYGYTTVPRSTVVAEDFRQGNMVIDLIDRDANAVVWEGHASGEGETNLAKIEARVNMVVSRMFQRYQYVAAVPET